MMRTEQPRGPLGCLLAVLGVLVVFGGLLAAGFFGLTWYHYSSTPDFLEYIRSRPVDIGVLDERIGGGEVLAEGRSWQTGELDPWNVSHEDPELEHVSLTLDVDLEHGADSLLRLRQRFLFVLAKEDWEHRGFRIETPQLQTHEDMRALVLVHLGDLDELVGEGSQGQGSAIVDVFLAAGAGTSSVRILRRAEDTEHHDDVLAELGLPSYSEDTAGFGALLTHVVGAPPVIGLIHHVRQPVHFGWQKRDGGSQSAGIYETRHVMSTNEYSYAFTVSIEDSTGSTSTRSFESSKAWNDEVW